MVAVGLYDDLADHEPFAVEKFYESKIERFDAEHVRLRSARETVEAALLLLERDMLQGFWIHLDVDVLHQSVMPAVNSPNPGGLTFAELIALLKPLVHSTRAVGMELTIFDPDLDPAGNYGAALVEMLAQCFSQSSTSTSCDAWPGAESICRRDESVSAQEVSITRAKTGVSSACDRSAPSRRRKVFLATGL